MNRVNFKLLAAGLLLTVLASHSQATLADDASIASFYPLHAVTIDAGQKRAVGYFTSQTGKCRLVLTLADAQSADEDSFQATRFEINIPEFRTGKYAADGQTFEFACGQHAEQMTFKRFSILASSRDR